MNDYLALLAQSTTASNNACLLPGTSNDDAAAYTKGATIGTTPCKLQSPSLESTERSSSELTNDRYKNLAKRATAGDNHQQADGGDGNKCKLLSGYNTNGYANCGGLATSPKVIAGYIAIPNTANGITLETKENLKTANREDTKPWYEAFEATNRLSTANDVEFRNDTGDLHRKTTLKAAVKVLLLAKPKATDTDITTAIDKIFGNKTDEKRTNLENAIDNTEIPNEVTKQSETTRLGSITHLAKLSEGMAYKLTKDLEEDAKPKEITKETTVTDKDCVGKKEASCTVDCELDGEICKPIKRDD
uniref:Variant surface glycoprotein 1125.5459 n=1 Tax=Trypanosoma brucei TaxID=5691 RepID=A0A1J0RCE2_9TRYP|nr:variant surface glycoprotein 1125.5459 [Trypanosoma brucei]